MNRRIALDLSRALGFAALVAALSGTLRASADFSGTPITFQVDGGWCWFQDPRAIITNGHVVIGTTAGTTITGVSTGGDEKATDYNIATGAITNFTLKAAYNLDDHASPAFTVLPDGRVMVVYCSHGADNYVYWRVSTNAGSATSWGAEQQSTVNITNDGNGNTYSNPFYLSTPNTVYSFSRTIGYDTNYSKFTGISATNNAGMTNASNYTYGGHFQYWKNPNNSGNGRPYVKYTSNGTNRIWLATTEDSPQNYVNSLYCGYVEFTSTGAGTVYTSTGTALGAISTSTAPTTAQANTGAGVASGTGYSYQPTQFTPIVKANANINNYDLSSSSPYGAGYAPWASSMRLDANGNPYIAFIIMRDTSGAYGNNLEYGYARLINGAWKVSRIGYAGYALYSGQNQYAGLIAVDPGDPNKVYFSANVNPVTGVALTAPDGNRHYQIFSGTTTDNGSTWSFNQMTNTSSDNVRPIIAEGGGQEALLWMRGSYASYTNYNTNVVGLIANSPVIALTTPVSDPVVLDGTSAKLRVAATVTETGFTGAFTTQWSMVSGPGSAVFANASSLDTTVQFPQSGSYVLQLSASDGTQISTAQITVQVGSGTENTSLSLLLKLDESSGTTAADSSGNAINGTLSGSTTWQPTGGARSGALLFNGSGSVTMPENSGSSSVFDNTSAFTLSYWVRANAGSFSNTPGIVSKRDAIATNNNFTTYFATNGVLTVDIESNNDRFTSNTVFATGTWYHVAIVFDGSLAAAQRVSLYVNGVLDRTATETSTALSDYTSSLKLGVTAAATNYFNGMIDDVRFYRRALPAADVASIASKTPAPIVACGTAPTASSSIAATLNGTADANGNGTLTALWTKVSGPGTVTFGSASTPATTATFSQAGTYVLKLSASNASAEVSDTVTITVTANPSVYADWINSAYPGVTDTSIVGPNADSDHNGVSNLIEFALGLTAGQHNVGPWSNGIPGLPVASFVDVSSSRYLTLQVRRPIGRLGITYAAQVTGDLSTWTSGVQVGSASANGDGSETVIFRDTVPMTASKRFIRLTVDQ